MKLAFDVSPHANIMILALTLAHMTFAFAFDLDHE